MNVSEEDICIGSGATANVLLVNLNGKLCAQKTVVNSDTKYLKREVDAFATIHHPCIVPLIAPVSQGETVFMMDFATGGSLNDIIFYSKYILIDGYDLTQLYIIAYGIAEGLKFIHSQNFIHRDIKPQNVLLTHDLRPMIADLGFVRELPPKESAITGVGTSVFMAPELINVENANSQVDVYSFAMTLFNMVAGYAPFDENSNLDDSMISFVLANVLAGIRPEIDTDMPMYNVITSGWQHDPRHRPTMAKIQTMISNEALSNPDVNHERFTSYVSSLNQNILDGTIENLKLASDRGIPFSMMMYGRVLFYGDRYGIEPQKHDAISIIQEVYDKGIDAAAQLLDSMTAHMENEEEGDSFDPFA